MPNPDSIRNDGSLRLFKDGRPNKKNKNNKMSKDMDQFLIKIYDWNKSKHRLTDRCIDNQQLHDPRLKSRFNQIAQRWTIFPVHRQSHPY